MSHRAAPLFSLSEGQTFSEKVLFPREKRGAHLRGTARELRGNCEDKFSEEER